MGWAQGSLTCTEAPMGDEGRGAGGPGVGAAPTREGAGRERLYARRQLLRVLASGASERRRDPSGCETPSLRVRPALAGRGALAATEAPTNERRGPPRDAGTPHLKQTLPLAMEIKPFQRCLATRPHPPAHPSPLSRRVPDPCLSAPASPAGSLAGFQRGARPRWGTGSWHTGSGLAAARTRDAEPTGAVPRSGPEGFPGGPSCLACPGEQSRAP